MHTRFVYLDMQIILLFLLAGKQNDLFYLKYRLQRLFSDNKRKPCRETGKNSNNFAACKAASPLVLYGCLLGNIWKELDATWM